MVEQCGEGRSLTLGFAIVQGFISIDIVALGVVGQRALRSIPS